MLSEKNKAKSGRALKEPKKPRDILDKKPTEKKRVKKLSSKKKKEKEAMEIKLQSIDLGNLLLISKNQQ